MLHTDDIEQKYQDRKFIKLFVRKNRDGKLGMINYVYYGDYIQFKESIWDETLKRYVEVENEQFDSYDFDIKDDDLPF